MQRLITKAQAVFAATLCFFTTLVVAQEAQPQTTLVISVAEQKLALLRDGGLLKKYPISTSKFGLGDEFGSYKTPLGRLRVCQKVGDDLTMGAVLKQRHATGEVLAPNSPGRDPIVTRIIWLDGLEPQNQRARSRGIYIHGTTEESKIGEPVSYGCIRMRSRDVVELFEEVPLDAEVRIIPEKLPRFPKYAPPKVQIIAAAPPQKPAASAPTPALAATKKGSPAILSTNSEEPGRHSASIVSEPAPTTSASLAMQGSILDAGLPQGPKIPTLPTPPAPKDVPRLSTYSPGLPAGSAFSLQGISRDLSPAIRAADIDAAAREASAKSEHPAEPVAQAEPTPAPAKPQGRIAFRAGAPEQKPKP